MMQLKMGSATGSVAALGVPRRASAAQTNHQNVNLVARSVGRRDADQCAKDARAPDSAQSRKDCALQPRVARNEQPWDDGRNAAQPQWGCVGQPRRKPQSRWGCFELRVFTQILPRPNFM